ncbi:hypothetical protein NUW58_g9063 [Xylaria curta]|uniref:Uncharacterized protein n=1 Tax=Xylaria curta TaxID=42375 RepID=A0ACC1N229_9PEZI|nr:hypothetical protein NUW58_g9063 [Xylaria curta]
MALFGRRVGLGRAIWVEDGGGEGIVELLEAGIIAQNTAVYRWQHVASPPKISKCPPLAVGRWPGQGRQKTGGGSGSSDDKRVGPWPPSQTGGIPGGQGGQPGFPSGGPWSPFSAGGQPGSPSNSPWSPSQSAGGQPGSPSAGSWPGSEPNPSTSPCDEGESGPQATGQFPPFQTPGGPNGASPPGSPSSGPWSPFSAGGQPGSPSNGPWSPPFQPTGPQLGSPSSGPWPGSNNPGGSLANTSPCTDGGAGASISPAASNTEGSPFPIITLTLSELPIEPSNAGNGGNGGSPFPPATQSNSANANSGSSPTPAGQGSPSISQGSPSGGQGSPSGGPSEPSGDSAPSAGRVIQLRPPQAVAMEHLCGAANSDPSSGTTSALPLSGTPGAEASGSQSPVSTGPSRGPFSSVPSSGWNFSTSASGEDPVSESTATPAGGPNPIETTSCSDSTTEPSESASLSPALTSSGGASTITSPSESLSSPAGGSDSETPAGCLSMTTMVISTMTFSWCDQVASSTPVGVSTTGQASIQNSGSAATNHLSPTPPPGGYEFGSPSVNRRSPSTVNISKNSVMHVPSTMATVVLPSRSSGDNLVLSKGPYCGAAHDQNLRTQDFDDLPPDNMKPGENPKPVPIFSPYHRFYYSGGFTVLRTTPKSRFKPSSGSLMLQFTPSSISNTSEQGIPPDTADIGIGPQKLTSCFSFNFTRIGIGCDSDGTPCSFAFTGFKYDRFKQTAVTVASQNLSIPACLATENCVLTPITVSGFDDLTSITIKAEVNGRPTIWWADDLAFGWFKGTCESAICRSSVPDGIGKPGWTVTGRRAASRVMKLLGARGW